MEMHVAQNAFPNTLDELEERYELRFVMGSVVWLTSNSGARNQLLMCSNFFWWRYEKNRRQLFKTKGVFSENPRYNIFAI